MRVVQITPAIAEKASGPSYSVVRLTENLNEVGTKTDLAALDWAPIPDPPQALRTFKLGAGHPKLGRSPDLMNWLRNLATTGEANVFHSNILWQFNSLYPSRAIKGTNVKLITAPRGSLSEWAMASGSKIKKIFWPLLQRPALKKAHCLHATATSEYDDFRRLGFKQPVCVLPNGVDIPQLLEIERKKTILFLGRLHPKKGIDILLHAWKELESQFPDWNVCIAGPEAGYDKSTKHSSGYKRLTEELGLQRVEFVGGLYDAEKLAAYQSASLFVLPSHSENFGLTVAESLAGGTPAIATHGTPWQGLNEHRAGWWIEVKVESLVAAMRSAMQTPTAELNEMGMNGRAWMEREFGWSSIATRMQQTYEWMVSGGRCPDHIIQD